MKFVFTLSFSHSLHTSQMDFELETVCGTRISFQYNFSTEFEPLFLFHIVYVIVAVAVFILFLLTAIRLVVYTFYIFFFSFVATNAYLIITEISIA